MYYENFLVRPGINRISFSLVIKIEINKNNFTGIFLIYVPLPIFQ